MLAVEAAVRAYAVKWGESRQVGDGRAASRLRYERWPNPPDSSTAGFKILADRGYPDDVIYAISRTRLSHRLPRISRLDKTLYALRRNSAVSSSLVH